MNHNDVVKSIRLSPLEGAWYQEGKNTDLYDAIVKWCNDSNVSIDPGVMFKLYFESLASYHLFLILFADKIHHKEC